MTIEKISRYYHTLKYVQLKQIFFQIFYRLRRQYRKCTGFRYPLTRASETGPLYIRDKICSEESLFIEDDKYRFTFLNLSHTFEKIEAVDWNYPDHGKLWTYNLNYFDFLNQRDLEKAQGIALIRDFIARIAKSRDGMEPFPIALRGINWIKFLNMHAVHDREIDDSLYAQYDILMDNLEYHLLGNHLLENGFSLLFGGYYFRDQRLFDKAWEILIQELSEQVLPDGAHFELTPMYHQIMLYRVLDCYNLMQNNPLFDHPELMALLREKASRMLGWLETMRYRDGSIPHLNDSTDGIAPTSSALKAYAQRLGITTEKIVLKESGYRKFVTDR
ncbi:MAG TPA: prenyltransferase, partial [Epsilonproteobacteria bacterium]|nr:prenyltransferase [Campylobacterota bacterium]